MDTAVLLAVLVAVTPALQVCVRPLATDRCQVAPIPIEADVAVHGVGGRARLRWIVDGTLVREVDLDLRADSASRNLLLLEPRSARHRVALEVRLGGKVATGVADVEPWVCPFDLAIAGVETVPGRRVRLDVANAGPSPSGPWVLRLSARGRVLYRSPMPSLDPGERYELDVPWVEPELDRSATAGRSAHGEIPPGGGVRMLVEVEVTPGDLDVSNNVLEFFAPNG